MRHNRIAEGRTRARAKIDHAFRHPRFFEQLEKFRRDGRRVTGRLQHYRVAANHRSQCHPRHDGAREIPRRNHRAHAQRNVKQRIAFPRHLHRKLDFRQPQRLACVIFTEVDGLGDIGVRLRPILADFKHQPGAVFKFAFAQQIAHAKQQRRAVCHRTPAPLFVSFQRRLHRRSNVLSARLLMHSYHLRRLRGIQRLDLVRSLHPLPADHQVILAPQLATHLLNGNAHLARRVIFGEIGQRLVDERPFVQAA